MTTHRLRDVALVLTSNVDKAIDPDEHPVRLCNYVDVYKNNLIHNDMPFKLGSANATEIKNFRLQVDDVIITKDSETADDIGVPALVKSTADDLVCGYHLSILRADRRRMIGPFLYWHLLSKKSQEDFGNAANGVTRYGLTLGGIKSIPINVPDLPTQRVIADFLNCETALIDALIEKKQRLVELLGEREKRSVSQMFENLALQCRIWRLKHMLASSLSYGANEASDGDDPKDVRYIRITDIDAHGGLRNDTFKSLPREKVRDYLLRDGDILLARSGATVGKSFLYRAGMGECCYAGYLIRASVNKHILLPEFLYYFTSTDQYWNRILGTNIKATIQNVSAEKYANLSLPVPTISVQREICIEIARTTVGHFNTQGSVNASIKRLKEYRSALITAAVTGQIDVAAHSRSGTTERHIDKIEQSASA